MRKALLTLAVALSTGIATLNAQSFQWAKNMGGAVNDVGYSVAIDALGNIYMTGFFQGIVDFDPGVGIYNLTSAYLPMGYHDIFVSKFDASGNFVWAKSMGGTWYDSGYSIAIDALGNVYTTGEFDGTVDFDPGAGTFNLTSSGYGDIFISKLDSSGNFVWAKKMGDGDIDGGLGIAIDASGNVYTTGYFRGTVDFDPGVGTFNLSVPGNPNDPDMFISKLDSSGNFVWAKNMGPGFGYSIALDALGHVYTTGSFSGTVDFDPGVDTFNLTSAGAYGIFISKLDSSGNFVWAKSMGGGFGHSIALDAWGYIYTTGSFYGTADFDPGPGTFNLTSAGNTDIFIFKLDSSGSFVWAKGLGGNSSDEGRSLAVGTLGQVYTTGFFIGTVDFDPGPGTFNLTSAGNTEIFISKLDSSGNFVWAKSMGGPDDDYGYSIALDTLGNQYTTGSFGGTVDFNPDAGTFNLNSAGFSDIFMSKLGNTAVEIFDITGQEVIRVYPNPTNGLVRFSAPNHVQLYSLTGQLMAERKQVSTLDLSNQAAGIYFLSLIDNNGQVIQRSKIVKE